MLASRLFSGPHQYPPKNFAAYGMLAFTSRVDSSPEEQDRFNIICNAYLSRLPHTSELSDVPTSQQMVTVWPIVNDEIATDLNKRKSKPESSKEICKTAVDNYDLVAAKRAIKEAQAAGAKLAGEGPYLIAWSPASEKGKPDTVVLYEDLSNVLLREHADTAILHWSREIEGDPSLWKSGFTLEKVRIKMQRLADNTGGRIMGAFKALQK